MTGSGLQAYLAGPHAFDCRSCHNGQAGILLKDDAHVGLISDPSWGVNNQCALCHGNIAESFSTSLHATLRGEHALFEARTGFTLESMPAVHEEYNSECNKCHATCGSCHISRPDAVGGGFIQSHRIKRTPDLKNQCTACHGSRVGDEYTGANEGYSADVHYVPNAMSCRECHTGAEMHGDGNLYEHRYEVENAPACGDCHDIDAFDNDYHEQHGEDFQCQVCHSQKYKNCNACHVGGDGITGPSWLDFKIGRNPIPDERSGEYVILRHIPIAEDTYSDWEGTMTSLYSEVPTWKYATPHNIKRWTARTDTTGGLSCAAACHNTPADTSGFFLRQADLDLLPVAEQEANQHLIVPDGPPPW